jgi:hypothetical protein
LCSKSRKFPVALSCPSLWLHPVCCYKRPLKKEKGILLLGVLLWAFWCGKLLEGKRIVEGKIAEGKGIVEGKILKGKGKNC